MTDFDTKAILDKALSNLPAHIELCYMARGDELTNKQCAAIVGGKADEVREEIWEARADERYDHVFDVLDDALEDEEEREALKQSDDFDEFRHKVEEKDESDVYRDLLKETSRRMVRFYIRRDGQNVELPGDSWRWEKEEVESQARILADASKLDYASNAESLTDIVENASYGGDLCILAYVEMDDLAEAIEHLLRDNSGVIRLTFTDPCLLIHQKGNGSGHDERVKGDVTIEVRYPDLDPSSGIMQLDHKNCGTGYSWSDIAGVVYSAYRADPKIELA